MVARPPAGPTLDSVRRDLEQIDRALVLLMAARLEAACTAIRCRSRVDGRVANPAQETRVLARARSWGEEFGLAPELTDTIFRAIIEAGKTRFTSGARPSVLPTPSALSPVRRAHALAHHAAPPVPHARGAAAP